MRRIAGAELGCAYKKKATLSGSFPVCLLLLLFCRSLNLENLAALRAAVNRLVDKALPEIPFYTNYLSAVAFHMQYPCNELVQ